MHRLCVWPRIFCAFFWRIRIILILPSRSRTMSGLLNLGKKRWARRFGDFHATCWSRFVFLSLLLFITAVHLGEVDKWITWLSCTRSDTKFDETQRFQVIDFVALVFLESVFVAAVRAGIGRCTGRRINLNLWRYIVSRRYSQVLSCSSSIVTVGHYIVGDRVAQTEHSTQLHAMIYVLRRMCFSHPFPTK